MAEAESLLESYPGQYSTPKKGCPVCGGPIRVGEVSVTNGPYEDLVDGRWECQRGCNPRTLAKR